jgi:transposase
VTIRKHVPDAVRIGLETGPLTTWLWQALTDAGLPMVCLDARQAKAALNMRINKTDDNDAEGLAHLVRSGWYREVRVKSREAMLVRSLLGARTQLLGMVTDLSNQIRGLMKTFGLVVPKGAGKIFEANVRRLLEGEALVAGVVLPLLESWRAVRARAADLDRQLLSVVRGSATCRRLMTIPGIGAVVAASFVAAVETPENFTTSRAVGAWIGLTPRRYQSGQVDYDGHISRRGDARLRALLYEAATAMLTRVQGESELRRWGLALKKRLGFKRAAVALARKMAVIMHAMWKNGADFDPKAAASVAV